MNRGSLFLSGSFRELADPEFCSFGSITIATPCCAASWNCFKNLLLKLAACQNQENDLTGVKAD